MARAPAAAGLGRDAPARRGLARPRAGDAGPRGAGPPRRDVRRARLLGVGQHLVRRPPRARLLARVPGPRGGGRGADRGRGGGGRVGRAVRVAARRPRRARGVLVVRDRLRRRPRDRAADLRARRDRGPRGDRRVHARVDGPRGRARRRVRGDEPRGRPVPRARRRRPGARAAPDRGAGAQRRRGRDRGRAQPRVPRGRRPALLRGVVRDGGRRLARRRGRRAP